MAREVFSLLGERAPPVPLAEPEQFKSKRKPRPANNIRWRDTPFTITIRDDGLILRRWRREADEPLPNAESIDAVTSATPMEVDTDLDEKVIRSREKAYARMNRNTRERAEARTQQPSNEPSRFDKYDVNVNKPSYDDELYENQIKSSDWTRQETDYLVQLYAECYGKWHVIVDRYEYTPLEQEAPQIAPSRTMEDLKTRFYEVSAKAVAAKTPLANMTTSEFSNHERMTKYNANLERERKRQKAALLTRSKAEREEERLLLAELQRIFNRRVELEAEGRELRHRLDHSLTDDVPNAAMYTSSQELNGLLQKLLQKEKHGKLLQQRRMQEAGMTSSPGGAGLGSSMHGRDKRASLQGPAQARQNLSAALERRYGVKSFDRLPPGVTFKSDRLAKARQAKSQAKTEKIASILAELGVPELLQMPTDELCKTMETVVHKINDLIDRRRIVEKEENDLRVEREKKALDSGEPASASAATTAPVAATSTKEDEEDEAENEQDEDKDGQDEEDGEDEEGEDEQDQDDEEKEDEDQEEDEEDEDEEEQEEQNQEDEQEDLDMDDVADDVAEGSPSADEREELADTVESPAPSSAGRSRAGTRRNKRSASVFSASSAGSGSRAASKRRKA